MAQHYDVAVIGGQPSGILAAALLAKRGRRVLLVDHGEDTSTYKRRGLRLPLSPVLVPNLEGSFAIRRVHEELGLAPEVRALTKTPPTIFQAVLPKRRFVLASEQEVARAELSAEFPEQKAAIDGFFTRLFALDDEISALLERTPAVAPKTLIEKWRARGWTKTLARYDAPFVAEELLAPIPKDHPLIELLTSPLAFFGHLTTDSPTTFQAVRLLARYFRGLADFSDRVLGFSAFLHKAAQSAGVEVKRGALVKRLELSKRRLKDLELEGDRNVYTADYFIANTMRPFADLLPAKAAPDVAELRATGALLVMNFVVHSDVIPLGMTDNVVLLNGRRAPRGEEPEDPPVLLQRFAVERAPGAKRDEDETCLLTAACPVRSGDVVHSPERFRVLKTQLVERVARVVPFLRDHLKDTSLPSDTQGWDVDKDGETRRIDPWRLHPLYEPSELTLFGAFGRSPRTAIKNLWHAGFDVAPGLGIEGDYLTASAIADGLFKDAGKKWRKT